MNFNLFFGVLVLIQICTKITTAQSNYEERVKSCLEERNNDVAQCLTFFLDLINTEHAADGIPALNIPSFDPVRLENLQFKRQDETISLNAIFTDIVATGFSKRNLQKVRHNKRQGSLNIRIMIPKFYVKGKYDLKGAVLLTNVTGKGDFTVDIDKVFATLKTQLGEKNEKNQVVPTVSNTTVDLGFGKIVTHLANLFNGDQQLGRAVNHFINENSEFLLKEVEGEVTKRIAGFVQPMLSTGLSYFPVEVLR